MKDDLVRHGWPQQKISVVWNDVDPTRYDPQNCKPKDVKKIREN